MEEGRVISAGTSENGMGFIFGGSREGKPRLAVTSGGGEFRDIHTPVCRGRVRGGSKLFERE